MNRIVLILCCIVAMSSCKKESASDLIDVTVNVKAIETQKLYRNDTLSLSIESRYTIDSVWLETRDTLYKKQPFIINEHYPLGINPVKLKVFYNGKEKTYEAKLVVYATEKPKELTYEVVNQYPHDASLFTQGFYFKDGIVYESAGGVGKSKAVKYTLGAKNFLKEYKVEKPYFAEGMTFLNDSLFQLTWKKRKLFVYDQELTPLQEYYYPRGLNEGWGITQKEKSFIVSDGSSVLHFINQHDFSSINKTLYVVDNENFYSKLNELEYHDGIIYANVWGSDEIILIDSESGAVLSKLNLKELVDQQRKNKEGVLNGIAIKGDHILLTGKNWSVIYEIKILP